ncbi:hypothetical protein LYNGBM3L_43270 [Moorena producens 3L]|uniref:Uncharacterized protein n=1 Tax=Moorena producens 3L TaxID=489825 RepID=F4XWF2_9CYAN|nr:hypothetical protein LYNGBM3L_43270 [Moorena producens 3L]
MRMVRDSSPNRATGKVKTQKSVVEMKTGAKINFWIVDPFTITPLG